MCTLLCSAQQFVFTPIDTSDGLSHNFVLHILRLNDGRIAATTPHTIDLWDGQRCQSIRKDRHSSLPLTGYRGAYHAYTDKHGRLWVKDYKKLWCYDQQMRPITDCLPDSANDVYVDDEGEVFFIHQDTTRLLLDLKTLQHHTYRFYADGTVTCHEGEKQLYAIRASLDSTAITSLVITDTLRKRFYQLIDQKLCLEFDTQTQQWTEIFRANRLHTISQTDANTAYIVSRDGMWKIDLNSRKAEQIEQVMMEDGTYISSSRLNTIYTDREGNIWIGSYDHGLLKGHSSTSSASSSPILWGILGGVLVVAGLIIAWWFLRRKKSPTQKEGADNTVPIDHELINRATTLVQQNLTSTNYTVERLAHDLCMDRTGLYKKTMAMLGQTPTAFIRSIRVKHAVQLIRETQLTMAEVAEQSGFSSASYMAKCFQEDLGRKPTEYRENQRECSVEST